MKKTITIFLLGILLVSCKQAIRDKDIAKLNGYWEIEKVNLPEGEYKEYKVNETIDFFEVKENKGFRQKVMPQLDGTYLTNGIKENITVSKEDGEVYIYYITNYGKWREEIIEIRDSILILKNEANLQYHYKRQVPFSLK
jgi:hypothetical protein